MFEIGKNRDDPFACTLNWRNPMQSILATGALLLTGTDEGGSVSWVCSSVCPGTYCNLTYVIDPAGKDITDYLPSSCTAP